MILTQVHGQTAGLRTPPPLSEIPPTLPLACATRFAGWSNESVVRERRSFLCAFLFECGSCVHRGGGGARWGNSCFTCLYQLCVRPLSPLSFQRGRVQKALLTATGTFSGGRQKISSSGCNSGTCQNRYRCRYFWRNSVAASQRRIKDLFLLLFVTMKFFFF